MNHSQAKRYAIQMVLSVIEHIDVFVRFMPEMEKEDREKVEGCLMDLFESLSPHGLKDSDYEEIGIVADWLRKERN